MHFWLLVAAVSALLFATTWWTSLLMRSVVARRLAAEEERKARKAPRARLGWRGWGYRILVGSGAVALAWVTSAVVHDLVVHQLTVASLDRRVEFGRGTGPHEYGAGVALEARESMHAWRVLSVTRRAPGQRSLWLGAGSGGYLRKEGPAAGRATSAIVAYPDGTLDYFHDGRWGWGSYQMRLGEPIPSIARIYPDLTFRESWRDVGHWVGWGLSVVWLMGLAWIGRLAGEGRSVVVGLLTLLGAGVAGAAITLSLAFG